MSKVEYGRITVTSAGNKIPILSDSSLAIQRIILWVGSSATESSAGYYDSSVTFTGSSAYQDENLTNSITHYRNISGTKTKVLEVTVTSTSSTGEFTINISTLTASTVLNFVVFGV